MICTVTVNPAIDKVIYLTRFNRDNTNRIKETKEVLGGKGTHVSVNLSILECVNKAFGIDFGETGRRIESLLEKEDIEMKFLHYDEGESRMNYALIEEDKTCTLISEKGKIVSKEQCQELIRKIYDEVSESDILILSGDASNTEIPLIYANIIEAVADKKVKIFLDASSENLTGSLKWKPFLIKPNEDELSQILGKEIKGEAMILEGLQKLSHTGISCIAVSCGGNGSYIWYQNEIYRVHPLKVNVMNTIGCGDAFLSGMAYGFEKGLEFTEILKIAASVSSATAESNSTVGFDRERARELRKRVKIEKLQMHDKATIRENIICRRDI